jgi:hypothetical protein
MKVVDEVRILWAKLERHFSQLVGVPIATRGLAGRASGKQFIPAEPSNRRSRGNTEAANLHSTERL